MQAGEGKHQISECSFDEWDYSRSQIDSSLYLSRNAFEFRNPIVAQGAQDVWNAKPGTVAALALLFSIQWLILGTCALPDGNIWFYTFAEKAPGQPPRSFEEDEDESGWRLRRSQLETLGASSSSSSSSSSSVLVIGFFQDTLVLSGVDQRWLCHECAKPSHSISSLSTPCMILQQSFCMALKMSFHRCSCLGWYPTDAKGWWVTTINSESWFFHYPREGMVQLTCVGKMFAYLTACITLLVHKTFELSLDNWGATLSLI